MTKTLNPEFKSYMTKGALAIWADAFWDDQTDIDFCEKFQIKSTMRFFDSPDVVDWPVPRMPQEYLDDIAKVAFLYEEKWGRSFEDIAQEINEEPDFLFELALFSTVSMGVGLFDLSHFPKDLDIKSVWHSELAIQHIPDCDFEGFCYLVSFENEKRLVSPADFSSLFGSDKKALYYNFPRFIVSADEFWNFLAEIKYEIATRQKDKEWEDAYNLSLFHNHVLDYAFNRYPLDKRFALNKAISTSSGGSTLKNSG